MGQTAAAVDFVQHMGTNQQAHRYRMAGAVELEAGDAEPYDAA